jgi:hypothetical protein
MTINPPALLKFPLNLCPGAATNIPQVPSQWGDGDLSGGAMTDVLSGLAELIAALGGWSTAFAATLGDGFDLLAPVAAGAAAALTVAVVTAIYFRSRYRSSRDILRHGVVAAIVGSACSPSWPPTCDTRPWPILAPIRQSLRSSSKFARPRPRRWPSRARPWSSFAQWCDAPGHEIFITKQFSSPAFHHLKIFIIYLPHRSRQQLGKNGSRLSRAAKCTGK